MGRRNRLRSAIALGALLAVAMVSPASGATFSNPAPVSLNSPADLAAPGIPYPSTIPVSGVREIADVNVILHGLTHTSPPALDVLLVGPAGQSVVLMSDLPSGSSASPACNTPASNLTLTFDDAAGGPIPGTAALTSGTYQPLDNDTPICGVLQTNDNYPDPADDPPNGTTLTDFNGTNPEGDWSLFVNDSRDGNSGAINGGWSLEIITSSNFSFGKLKKNKHNGTASLAVDVPGPGTLGLSGKGVKAQRPARATGATASKAVSAAGTVKLLVKAKGKAKHKLNKTGKAKVKASVTFTPTGGDPNTETKRVKLVKKLD